MPRFDRDYKDRDKDKDRDRRRSRSRDRDTRSRRRSRSNDNNNRRRSRSNDNNNRRRSRSNDNRRRDDRDDDNRKKSRRSDDSPPNQSRQVIDNNNLVDDQWNNNRGRGPRIPCKFFQMGMCKKGNVCQFSHTAGFDNNRYMNGNEFQPNFPPMNFNPDNNFPNQFNMPVFPVNDEAQFHANAFLQNLQQQPMQESNNVIQESNVINKIDTYIHSDEDDDVKDKIVVKEQIPKIWALEDPSLLISKNLCGIELFQKLMLLRGIDVNNTDENNTSQSIIPINDTNTEMGLDDLLASIGTSTHVEEKESSVDDLFALMGGDDKKIEDDNYNDNQEMNDDHKNHVEDESNTNKENETEEDDMYGDLYGDLGDDNNVEEQQEVTDNIESNIMNKNDEDDDDENMINSNIKQYDNKMNSIDINENQIIKHTIRKEIPFYLQNMSYDRLNIFHNPQGGFGVVHLLNNILSLIKNKN